jgi:hypothetical protein
MHVANVICTQFTAWGHAYFKAWLRYTCCVLAVTSSTNLFGNASKNTGPTSALGFDLEWLNMQGGRSAQKKELFHEARDENTYTHKSGDMMYLNKCSYCPKA